MRLYSTITRFTKKFDETMLCIKHGLIHQTDDVYLYESHLASAIISLHDSWAVACRAIVLNSAEGGYITRGGTILQRSPVLLRHQNPLEFLQKTWSFKKQMGAGWEPNWFIPKDATRAAHILQVQNYSQILGGLGATTHADALRHVRNVVAHSLPDTWKKFLGDQRALGYTNLLEPAEYILSRGPSGVGKRLIDEWTEDLKTGLIAAIA